VSRPAEGGTPHPLHSPDMLLCLGMRSDLGLCVPWAMHILCMIMHWDAPGEWRSLHGEATVDRVGPLLPTQHLSDCTLLTRVLAWWAGKEPPLDSVKTHALLHWRQAGRCTRALRNPNHGVALAEVAHFNI
jgi:hypothetical protein